MQHVYDPKGNCWEEQLSSVLTQKQLEACEDRIAAYPPRSIFDDLSLTEWKQLRALSYLAFEPKRRSADIGETRAFVQEDFAAEARFLFSGEDALLVRLVLHGGTYPIEDMEELPFAESLLKRMWCTASFEEEDLLVTLHPVLMDRVEEIYRSDTYKVLRQLTFQTEALIHSILYTRGGCHLPSMTAACSDLLKQNGIADFRPEWIERSMKAAFEYVREGDADYLVHPALRNAKEKIRRGDYPEIRSFEESAESILGGMNDMLPQEKDAQNEMLAAVLRCLRPECEPAEVCNDLRFMAKQGASLNEMREVLSNTLMSYVTPKIENALIRLQRETVPWENGNRRLN